MCSEELKTYHRAYMRRYYRAHADKLSKRKYAYQKTAEYREKRKQYRQLPHVIEYEKKYRRLYNQNKRSVLQQKAREDNEIKKWYIAEHKAKYGCQFCGEKDIACLQYHHKDPKEKQFELGYFRHHPIQTIRQEIDKCILLCANCHLKLHYHARRDG